jgi:hypothetical protein
VRQRHGQPQAILVIGQPFLKYFISGQARSENSPMIESGIFLPDQGKIFEIAYAVPGVLSMRACHPHSTIKKADSSSTMKS